MTAQHIPDIVLERYRLNELPPFDAAQLAREIDRDGQLRERLAAMDRSDEQLRDHVQQLRSRMAGRDAPRRARAMRWQVPAAVAVGAVLVMAVWQTRPSITPTSPPETADRIKGGADSGRPALAVYRRTRDGSEQLADGSVVHAGDLIRVGYRAAGHSYGVIVSIDGRGAVTMHLPPAGDHAARLKNDPTVLLEQAYELDDAPRWERFYFVTGDMAFDAAPVLKAAQTAADAGRQRPPADLQLPHGLEQAGFTLQKESER
jgi:hypothetical protein